jgi:hypothetical protein
MRSLVEQGEASADGPRVGEVVFEIGLVVASHLGLALLIVVLALGTQASV